MLLALLRRRTRDDDGFALLTVIMSMFVLTVIVTGAMTYAMQTQIGSRRDQDSNGALSAARAGVDEMLSRMNQNDTYWQKYPGYSGNAADYDCTNVSWQRPWPVGTPCGWGAATAVGWTAVPGSSGATYHYDLDLSNARTRGVVLITATGKVRNVTRTVQSALLHDGFGEFLYLTDYETLDPATEAIFGVNNVAAQAACSKHFWEGRPGEPDCEDINFVGGDTITGPLHTNDALLLYGNPGPVFKGPVTTSWPACDGVTAPASWPGTCYRPNGAPTPTFEQGLAYRALYTLPTSIGVMRQYVDPLQTSTPGCLYSGPTRIVFNSNGTMQVWSRWSKGPLNPGCGNPGAAWPSSVTVNVPDNNIIYVEDVPSAQTSPAPMPTECPDGAIGDGLPVAQDYNKTLRDALCNLGTVFIEGELQGKVTVSAENNIIVTGDTTYANGVNGIDTLGLIATNSVKIYHPVFCVPAFHDPVTNLCTKGNNRNRPSGSRFEDPVVQAAILTLAHSFTVEAYHLGNDLGTLNVFGAIAQRYRGPVGTFGVDDTGYLKDYVYDTRLKYAPPPFFLNPVAASWGAKTYGEIKRAY